MKITISEQDSIVIIKVDCSVLQEHIPQFKERLKNLIDENKYWFIFDLQDAEYISSLGISILVNLKNSAEENGGDLVLANVNHLIRNLLELTNLLDKLEIFNTVENAIQDFKNRMEE